jgi:hypothetical protein
VHPVDPARGVGGAALRQADGGEVDGGDLPAARGEPQRVPPRARRQVERAAGGQVLHGVDHGAARLGEPPRSA